MDSQSDDRARFEFYWACPEAYQFGVGAWALRRHGSANQIKGIVHECAFVLRHNANPSAVLKEGVARLSRATNDRYCDITLSRGGRIQLKDTPGSARTTAARTPEYRAAGVRVMGTPETVGAVAGYGEIIQSSGISTAHNEGIAARAGSPGGVRAKAVIGNTAAAAAAGAVIGAVVALLRMHSDLRDGRIDGREFVSEVLRHAATYGAAAGSAAAVGTIVAGVVRPGWEALILGGLAAVAVGTVVRQKGDDHWPVIIGAASAMITSLECSSVSTSGPHPKVGSSQWVDA